MTVTELIIIAVGLSMDAFAVSVGIGLASPKLTLRQPLMAGLYFGGFQAAMPLFGYYVGTKFAERISAIDHWIAFALLAFIGAKMIKESLGKNDGDGDGNGEKAPVLTFGEMLPPALATSIDALVVGVSFAFLEAPILPAVSLIGGITFALSMAGVKLGNAFGARHRSKAELAGGALLIFMGIKILAEHIGLI